MAVHVDQLVAAPARHEARRAHLLDVVLGEDDAVALVEQADAVERQRRLDPGQLEQRRREVEQRDRPRNRLPRAAAVGEADDQRHAHRPLVEAALLHHSPLAEHVAVVAREDDDRVLGLAALRSARRATRRAFGRRRSPGHSRRGAARSARPGRRDRRRRSRGPRCPAVHRGVAGIAPLRQRDLGALVEVPQLLRDDERVVGMVVGGDEEERLVGAGPRLARAGTRARGSGSPRRRTGTSSRARRRRAAAT